tara:strand:- start:501 stop:1190 length:690 start_codon:yes stop_codon:yes gene_type:complete
MSVFTTPSRAVLLIVALAGTSASAGVISASVDGINDAFWQWDVPFLQPGQTWTRDFAKTSADGTAYVEGTIDAGVRADGRYAWLNLTDFKMGATRAVQLDFVFTANVDYGTLFNGWANPIQIFDADQALNSASARIDWSKGAVWDNIPLPPLAGYFRLNDLGSTLSGNSGRFDLFFSPLNLRSQTQIGLLTGGLGDEVTLPDSAEDFIEIPGPATLALLGCMIAARRRR